jgi:hypothetical protein
MFGCFTLTTVAIMTLYMPESKGRPLEQIHEAFNEPIFKGWPSVLRRRVVQPLSSRSGSEGGVAGMSGSGEGREGIELESFAKASGLRMEVGGVA